MTTSASEPAADERQPTPPGAGHRSRLRDRLLDGGPDALLDHELIEYLLALAIPRRDTKPLAKELLRQFGGLGALMTADSDALRRVPGMGDTTVAALKIVQATALRMLRQDIENAPMLGSWQALLDYLRADMAYLNVERVRVLYLNSRNVLIRDVAVSDGSVNQSAIYVREVIKQALELSATSLIVVHNHPSGDTSPSRQDIAITRELADAASKMGMALHDHIIIGRSGHSSMRAMGLL